VPPSTARRADGLRWTRVPQDCLLPQLQEEGTRREGKERRGIGRERGGRSQEAPLRVFLALRPCIQASQATDRASGQTHFGKEVHALGEGGAVNGHALAGEVRARRPRQKRCCHWPSCHGCTVRSQNTNPGEGRPGRGREERGVNCEPQTPEP